jgi:hypothetical protein
MARSFYAPGFAVFKRVSFLAGFMLAGTMFLLPAIAAATLFGSAGHDNYEAAAIVGALTLLASMPRPRSTPTCRSASPG